MKRGTNVLFNHLQMLSHHGRQELDSSLQAYDPDTIFFITCSLLTNINKWRGNIHLMGTT